MGCINWKVWRKSFPINSHPGSHTGALRAGIAVLSTARERRTLACPATGKTGGPRYTGPGVPCPSLSPLSLCRRAPLSLAQASILCVVGVVVFFFPSRSLVDSERGLLRHRFMAALTGLNVP